MKNYLGLRGIDFTEFASPDPIDLHELFLKLGFSRTMKHKTRDIDLYEQNHIVFLLNKEKGSFADHFQQNHGPCICSMGWGVENSEQAFGTALERGAKATTRGDYRWEGDQEVFSIQGIGESNIYLTDSKGDSLYKKLGFVKHHDPINVTSLGFTYVDHLTNNVYRGTMDEWQNFYKNVFGFEEMRFFDIEGKKTGLQSYALMSPCGTFAIPINESKDDKSQIQEYLNDYKGPGVQHLALGTKDILKTVSKLKDNEIETLDIDDDYYQEVFNRVEGVKEDHQKIQDLQILVDGDEKGYLLQIFTKNLIGPIFFEIIQRKGHDSFGEGNFGALFRAIERDQERRGVLK